MYSCAYRAGHIFQWFRDMQFVIDCFAPQIPVGVIPILIGPMQVILAILPAILVAIFGVIINMLKPSSLKIAARILWRNKFVTLAAMAGIACLWWGGAFLSRRLGGFSGTIEIEQADWPMFRRDHSRRAATLDSDDPTGGGEIWRFIQNKTFYSSPAVVGDVVFVASANQTVYSDRGTIYLLNADNGSVLWSYSPRGFRATFSSPSVSGDYLVCGEGLHFTRDARISCLSIRKRKLLWEYTTKSHVESSPCIYDGKVYIGAGDDGLYCFALDPDLAGKPVLKWHLDGAEYPDCETSPIAWEGKIYFTLGMGGKAVCCVDAQTGVRIWRTETPAPVFGTPCLADGRLFAGMGNANFIETEEQVRQKELQRLREKKASQEEISQYERSFLMSGFVWAFDAKTGEVIWKYQTDRTVLASVVHADGRIYFCDRGGTVTSVNLDGRDPRRKKVHEPIIASPAVGRDHVYVLTVKGRLYCLDKLTLEPVWETPVGTGGQFLSSPVVARGHIYVGTEGGGFVCLGEPQRGTRVALWSGPMGGPGRSGWADGTPLPVTPRFVWRYPRAGEDQEAAAEITAPPAWAEGALYVPAKGKETGLAKLTLGGEKRDAYIEAWFYTTSNTVVVSPAIRGKQIYLVDGRPGEKARHLHVLDAEKGRATEKIPVEDGANGRLYVNEDSLAVLDGTQRLSFFGIGERLVRQWAVRVSEAVGYPLLYEGMIFFAEKNPPVLKVVSCYNGNEVGRFLLPACPTTGPVVSGELVAVGTVSGLFVANLTGKTNGWSVACGEVVGEPVCDERYLAVCTAAGEIRLFDWQGKEKLRRVNALVGAGPMLWGDVLYYFTGNSIERVDLATGEASSWL
ncbi:MAG: PQQ-binding-like beta-propeller repeat protein, partial [Kiritimatiellae bacterium]|nr:PQQ-binding-like beta-propeller repeat protein [Kiritimatiellia bacterium]